LATQLFGYVIKPSPQTGAPLELQPQAFPVRELVPEVLPGLSLLSDPHEANISNEVIKRA
jgi:hypothetical protein